MGRPMLPALALSLAAVLAGGSAASAATLSKTAASGKTTKIDEYTGWNNDCSFLTISVNVSSAPAHGTVTSKVARGRITNAAVGSAGSCFGKPTRVLQVYYRGKAGYQGSRHLLGRHVRTRAADEDVHLRALGAIGPAQLQTVWPLKVKQSPGRRLCARRRRICSTTRGGRLRRAGGLRRIGRTAL